MDAATALAAEPSAAPDLVPAAADGRLRRVPRLLVARRWGLIAMIGVALVGAGLADLRVWPPLATVMSASMVPTINTGDVVVLKRMQALPRVGDVVAVTVPDAARTRYGYPPEVVHRVVRVSPAGEITTKGDARPRPDPFVSPRAAVRAKVIATVPAAGRVLAFLTSGLGLLWLAGGAMLLIVMPLLDRQRDTQRREAQSAASLQSQLQALSEELSRLHTDLAAQARQDHELERRLRDLIGDAIARSHQDNAGAHEHRANPAPDADPGPPAAPLIRPRSGGLLGALGRFTRTTRRASTPAPPGDGPTRSPR